MSTWIALTTALAITAIASYAIHLASTAFEGGADYLGRNLPPGVKGATLNAIASSLPELFTTIFLLFYLADTTGFAAGLATCAGSAMFNMTVIPGLCILLTRNVMARSGEDIVPNKRLILRDGLVFVLAEIILLGVIGLNELTALVGLGLCLGYGIYAISLIRQIRQHKATQETPQDQTAPIPDNPGRGSALIHLDFKNILFADKEWTKASAITVLLGATVVMGIACHFLAGAVLDSASALGISPFFTAVILAAAGTSIPDTLLSIQDAKKGNYDDALSNAFGSNIFNIFVALGLPILLFALIHGPIVLHGSTASLASVEELHRVQTLCLSLIAMSFFAVATLAAPSSLKKRHGFFLIGLYTAWAIFVVSQA